MLGRKQWPIDMHRYAFKSDALKTKVDENQHACDG